ncbi:hypothetical protein GQ43DRAFT_11914 [Delitschia confertaspora ATCC 74209]|uniref:Uncharacterized protein n=1 Tax=Delitschia confertaspora ATCC 74209 TaxID=1513339 RepID=A0A9P4MWC3_9PLEO|nr:hypothetical protein GQ43DRAFT_11914 [Delitschia confertaspora ATCC 74209]
MRSTPSWRMRSATTIARSNQRYEVYRGNDSGTLLTYIMNVYRQGDEISETLVPLVRCWVEGRLGLFTRPVVKIFPSFGPVRSARPSSHQSDVSPGFFSDLFEAIPSSLVLISSMLAIPPSAVHLQHLTTGYQLRQRQNLSQIFRYTFRTIDMTPEKCCKRAREEDSAQETLVPETVIVKRATQHSDSLAIV